MRPRMWAAAVAPLVVTVAFPGTAWSVSALAVGSCDRYGFSYNYETEDGARERALNECGANGDVTCRVIATVRDACAAFAVDFNDRCAARGWATGITRRAAERAAIADCRASGGADCQVQGWVCEDGGGGSE